MSKRWTLDDDRFLVRYHEIGADYIANHDLGFKSKGAGTARIAKLKEAGVFDKIVAHLKAETEMLCAHTIAFGPEWAKDIAAAELADLAADDGLTNVTPVSTPFLDMISRPSSMKDAFK